MREKAHPALLSAGITEPDVRFDGLNATLFGVPGSPAVSRNAMEVVRAIQGVGEVNVRIQEGAIAASVPVPQVDFPEIEFEPSSAVIQAGSLPDLDAAARNLLRAPDLRVEIQGHTDSVGDPGWNLVLSRARAESVRNYLVTRG